MKKYSTTKYYNYARYLLEGEAGSDIDPDLVKLYNAVDKLEARRPGSAKNFIQVVQNRYGIRSVNDLKNNMSTWIKVPVGGISIVGFSAAMVMAIKSGLSYAQTIAKLNMNDAIKSINDIPLAGLMIPFACIMVAFVFYKILKCIIESFFKTESVINKSSYYRQKIMIENGILVNKMNRIIESDVSSISRFDRTAEKSEGLCKRMFNWIKEKVAAGWGWIKKHPYITTAFLIVIGFVFYYIYSLRGQLASANNTIATMNASKALSNPQLNADLARQALAKTNPIANNIIDNASKLYAAHDIEGLRAYLSRELNNAYSTMSNEELAALLRNFSNIHSGSSGTIATVSHSAYNTLTDMIGAASERYTQMANIFN